VKFDTAMYPARPDGTYSDKQPCILCKSGRPSYLVACCPVSRELPSQWFARLQRSEQPSCLCASFIAFSKCC